MQIPGQIFREYDIRGVADRDLDDELATALGLRHRDAPSRRGSARASPSGATAACRPSASFTR